nr:MIT C-terminal domain-containing protein [Mycobacterium sp. 141]
MELIEALATVKDPADELNVTLVTGETTDGPDRLRKQMELLVRVKQGAIVAGINLDVKWDPKIHDRWIFANSGWRINLGRGLDTFQRRTPSVSTRLRAIRWRR